MLCPKCSSKNYCKNGFKDNRQRYLCKDCSLNYSTEHGRGKPKALKQQALELYLEGLGFRAIGRQLGVSNVAILKWVRKAASILRKQLLKEMPREQKALKVMELDEMWHFALKKSQKRGSGSLSIEKLLP